MLCLSLHAREPDSCYYKDDAQMTHLSLHCRVTLDTPMNRKSMPEADFSSWTPLEFLVEWVSQKGWCLSSLQSLSPALWGLSVIRGKVLGLWEPEAPAFGEEQFCGGITSPDMSPDSFSSPCLAEVSIFANCPRTQTACLCVMRSMVTEQRMKRGCVC